MDKIQEWIRYNFQDQFEAQAQEYEEKIQALEEESRKKMEAMEEGSKKEVQAMEEEFQIEKERIAGDLISSTSLKVSEIARITGIEESKVKEIAELKKK